MKKIATFALLTLFLCTGQAQQKTIQERLGYPANTRLLIIHGDDLGVSHSQNAASISAFSVGVVNSGSIMVPCPWFPEIADYYRGNPRADLGLHLTLTAEWNLFKWGPVRSHAQVPGLVNGLGYFYSSVDSVQMHASAAEVAAEMDAQVQKALAAGLDITHLDAHMGTALSRKDYAAAYLALGRKYRVPVLLPRMLLTTWGWNPDSLLTDRDVVMDYIVSASPDDFMNGMGSFYTRAIKALEPGLTYLIIHLAYDDEEMRAVTKDHPDWGAAWRQADYDFFTSEACRTLLKEQNVQLITWRELRDRIVRGGQ